MAAKSYHNDFFAFIRRKKKEILLILECAVRLYFRIEMLKGKICFVQLTVWPKTNNLKGYMARIRGLTGLKHALQNSTWFCRDNSLGGANIFDRHVCKKICYMRFVGNEIEDLTFKEKLLILNVLKDKIRTRRIP